MIYYSTTTQKEVKEMEKGAFLFAMVFSAIGCENHGEPSVQTREHEDPPPHEDTRPEPKFAWGVEVSTIQLVHEAVDPARCPSGWTALQAGLARDGSGQLPPLQAAYVNRFNDLHQFMRACMAARSAIGETIPTIRLSTVWPCWAADASWRTGIGQTIQELIGVGWQVELTLLHHDSYPAELHRQNGIELGGWAHENATNSFTAYVESVVTILRDVLPAGARIYLANELEASFFSGYLDPSGKWPPGGKNAGRAMTRAFRNARDSLREGAQLVRNAGFDPAIAVNVRPLVGSRETAADNTLEHLHNWWLLDALLRGCNDDTFSGTCDTTVNPVPITIGLTFYGRTEPSEETVELAPGITMTRPVINVEPDPDLFRQTLRSVHERYPEAPLGVAEIGFSSGSIRRMDGWLREYRDAVGLVLGYEEKRFIQLHTLFEGAEFSEGEWHFHLIGECGNNNRACEFTEWGMRVMEILY